MIKKIILICLASGVCLTTLAQSLADIQNPKIIPPSPDAASLGKYAQIPVDKSTGIPEISIPLYEIKTARLNLPLTISYHASGIRVDEISSWVGAGWTLNSGGVVTRSIIGGTDENGYGFFTSTVPQAADLRFPRDSAYMQLVAKQVQDTQPDNFFYNFNNYAGAFVFGVDKKPVLVPYRPLNVSFNVTTGFDIIDEHGNKYSFNNKETVSSPIHVGFDVSSWYLTRIVSADRTDTIRFVYNADVLPQNDLSISFTQNFGPLFNPSNSALGASVLWPISQTNNIRAYNPVRISQILFKGGKVDFIMKGGRLDNANYSLDSVIVSNYSVATRLYNRMKSFKLQTGYTYSTIANPPRLGTDEPSKHRLILTDLIENDKNGIAVKTHHFDYNTTMLPPVHNFAQDQWGYYNGKITNATLLQTQQIASGSNVYTVGGTEGADRSCDPVAMQAGVLQKITYPTKGYTIFAYEANQQAGTQFTTYNLGANAEGYYQESSIINYTPTSGMLSTGGAIFHVHIVNTGRVPVTAYPSVQIVQVSNGAVVYSNSATTGTVVDVSVNLPLTANVQYQIKALAQGGTSTNSSGDLPSASLTTTYQVPSGIPNYVGGLRISSVKNYDSNGVIATTESYKYGRGESGEGEMIWNSLMTDHIGHTFYFSIANNEPGQPNQIVQAGETIYSNSSVYQLSSLNGSPVSYAAVSVYHGDSVQNIGKSIYAYRNFADSLLFTPNDYMLGIKLIPVTWKNGEPIYEGHYRNNGSNQYLLEQEKFTNYNYLYRTAARGLIIGYAFETMGFSPQNNWPYWPVNNFYWFDYPISSGSLVPNQKITISYAPNGVTKQVQDTVRYYYDNLIHIQPTRIVSYDGKGDSLMNKISYPQDMVIAGTDPTGVYNAMSVANVISPQIEFTQYKNGTQLMKSRTNYATISGIINPQTVEVQILGNPSEIRLNYQKYDDRGNLLTVLKPNGPPTSYQWGYNKQYPVAQANNASSNDIFYDSFEEGDGNSTLNDAKTGHYSHTATYSKALIGLDNGSYTLSYWQKSGGVWSLQTSAVTVSGGAYTISLNTQIDDVRFCPASTQLVTYTYDPLVGMTSSTDAKGLTTSYEYDGFQRLMNIRDKDQNIIKHMDYHYQGQ